MTNSTKLDFKEDHLGYYIGEISTAAYMVSRNVKPVYNFCFPRIYLPHLLDSFEELLNTFDLYYTDTFYKVCDIDYVDFSIYKYPYLERILRFKDNFRGDLPDLSSFSYLDFIAFREWVNGKIYGFGDREIGEHIDKYLTRMYGENYDRL